MYRFPLASDVWDRVHCSQVAVALPPLAGAWTVAPPPAASMYAQFLSRGLKVTNTQPLIL